MGNYLHSRSLPDRVRQAQMPSRFYPGGLISPSIAGNWQGLARLLRALGEWESGSIEARGARYPSPQHNLSSRDSDLAGAIFRVKGREKTFFFRAAIPSALFRRRRFEKTRRARRYRNAIPATSRTKPFDIVAVSVLEPLRSVALPEGIPR